MSQKIVHILSSFFDAALAAPDQRFDEGRRRNGFSSPATDSLLLLYEAATTTKASFTTEQETLS